MGRLLLEGSSCIRLPGSSLARPPFSPSRPCFPSLPFSTHHDEPVMTSSGRAFAAMCDLDPAGGRGGRGERGGREDNGTAGLSKPAYLRHPVSKQIWGRQSAELSRGAESVSCRREWLIATEYMPSDPESSFTRDPIQPVGWPGWAGVDCLPAYPGPGPRHESRSFVVYCGLLRGPAVVMLDTCFIYSALLLLAI